MTGRSRLLSHSRAIPAVTLILVCIMMCTGGVFCCGAAWFTVVLVDELEEVDSPQILVEKEVTIDTSALPEHPTEEDWYSVAVEALQNSDWGLSPDLTRVSVLLPCQSDPVLDELDMDFADVYFDGVIPHLKMASVSLDRTTNTASVMISYQALRWRRSPLGFSKMEIGLHQALAIADHYGGQEFREGVNDRCVMSIFVTDYEWRIGYKELGQPIWSDLRIRVDAQSGKARQLAR